MNTRDYLTKIQTQLQDHNSYKPVNQNSTSATANNTFTLIQYMHFQHLSAYITHFIQLLASYFPSHIKMTKHFLILIEKLPPLSLNALLVRAEVTFLCTNIPHEDSLVAMIHFIEKYSHLLPKNCPPPHIVHAIIDFIHKHSTFKFRETHIH